MEWVTKATGDPVILGCILGVIALALVTCRAQLGDFSFGLGRAMDAFSQASIFQANAKLLIAASAGFAILLMVVVLSAAAAPVQHDVPSVPTVPLAPVSGGTSRETLWVLGAGFLTLLATQIFTILKEYRQRKWDIADRNEARAQTLRVAIAMAKLQKSNKDDTLKELMRNTELTQAAVGEAQAAFSAANNFNDKLEKLTRVVLANMTNCDEIDSTGIPTEKLVELLNRDRKKEAP